MWCGYHCLFIFAAISGIYSDLTPSKTLKLSVVNSSCIPDMNGYNVTALENKPLDVIVECKDMLPTIQCHNSRNSNQDLKPQSSPKIAIANVTKEHSGSWNCTISTKTKETANFVVKVRVRFTESLPTIAVNYMRLKAEQASFEINDYDHLVTYRYQTGERVDMLCYHPPEKLSSNYNFKIMYNNFLNVTSKQKLDDSNTKIGFNVSINLKDKHDKQYIDCKIELSSKDYQTTRTLFILGYNLNSDTDFIVNNRKVRFLQKNRDAILIFNQSSINITGVGCARSSNYCNVSVASGNESCNFYAEKITDQCDLVYLYKNNEEMKLPIKQVNLTMTRSEIKLKVSEIHAVMVIHVSGGDHVYYYEIGDPDQNVTITCSDISNVHDKVICIEYNKQSDCNSISKIINLLSKEVKCMLKTKDDIHSSPIETNIVKFLRKDVDKGVISTKLQSTTPSNGDGQPNGSNLTPNGDENFIYIVIGVVVGIVSVCIAVILYRKKKRNQTDSVVAFGDNLVTETEIPPYPPQWSPTVNEEYSEPCGRLPIYATALPKHLRHRRHEEADSELYSDVYSSLEKKYGTEQLPYAELHIVNKIPGNEGPSNTEPSYVNKRQELNESPYAEVREMYSQVLPKSKRKNNKNTTTYANCYPDSPYENSCNTSGNPEYVEPTYTQPHLTHRKQ